MKKLFVCCVFAGFMSVGVMPFAHSEITFESCDLGNGTTLSHGIPQPIACRQAAAKNPGLEYASQCEMYCNNGNLIYGATMCIDGYYRVDPYGVPSDLYQRCVDAETACGMSESPAHWNETYCDCNDEVWSGDALKCIESDDHAACKNDEKAHWEFGNCVCVDSLNYSWDKKTHKCVKSAKQEQCEKLATGTLGDGALKDKIKWDSLNHLCKCIVGANENPDDYYITNVYTCEKWPSVQRREEFAANQPAANAKLDSIKQKISELKNISDVWDRNRSHWKNADGNFNTARLASDSVAGVVLGTVGGVITSNIIKKNQIKGGFEDINCVIGGQRVAGFADQFNVGIQ